MHKLISLPWHWLPPLITLSMVFSMHIDVPYYDQWDLLPLLHAYYQKTLQWQDLLAPHNGHILFLPKLVMLVLAVSTHWNTLAEVLFSFSCMLINWLLLQKIASTLLVRPLSNLEKLAISLLVFSLVQAQNWLWGWQLQIPMALLFILAGLSVLLYTSNHLLALMLAISCAAAATVCFAGSLPFWIAATPLVWQRQRYLLILWLLASMAGIVTYAHIGLQLTNTAIPVDLINPAELLRHIRNTMALLGNIVARFDMLAAVIAGTTGLFIICQQYPKLAKLQQRLTATIVLFSLGSSLMVSISRAGISDDMMLASRYGTLMLPFWTLAATLLMRNFFSWRKISAWHATGLLLLASLLANDMYSIKEWQQLHNRFLKGSIALMRIDDDEGQKRIGVINPRKNHAQAIAEAMMLRNYQLSFYRETAP